MWVGRNSWPARTTYQDGDSTALVNKQLLRESWTFSKVFFRSIGDAWQSIPQTNNLAPLGERKYVTEGTGYVLIMAVIMDDRPFFDLFWNWAWAHLKRTADNQFGWVWGETTGLISQVIASDGSMDVCYALLLAYEKWGYQDHLDKALLMITDLYTVCIKVVGDRLVMFGGDEPGYDTGGNYRCFTSYWYPKAFKKFSEYDTAHTAEWLQAATDVFTLLEDACALNAVSLNPQKVRVDSVTSLVTGDGGGGSGTSPGQDFNADAHRIFWRLASSRSEYPDEVEAWFTAHQYNKTYYDANGFLRFGFDASGAIIGSTEYPSMYAALFAQQWSLGNTAYATQLYIDEILSVWHNGYWGPSVGPPLNGTNDYFAQASIWFALAAAMGVV